MKKVKGFTLIEMGIVIFILSVLTGMIVPRLYAFIKEAEKATDISNGKLLYTATLLVVATDDDVEMSFFNTEGAGGAYNHKIPQYKTINGEQVFVGMKTVSVKDGLKPVTRIDGVDRETFYIFAKRQKLQSSDNSPNYAKDYTGMWEDTGSNSKNDIRKRSTSKNMATAGHSKFVVALSEKMEMPVRGDTTFRGKPVSNDKTYFRMRYTTHDKEAVEGRKYAYRWQIVYDPQNMEPQVWVGYHQCETCFQLYPAQSPEYTAEHFSEW